MTNYIKNIRMTIKELDANFQQFLKNNKSYIHVRLNQDPIMMIELQNFEDQSKHISCLLEAQEQDMIILQIEGLRCRQKFDEIIIECSEFLGIEGGEFTSWFKVRSFCDDYQYDSQVEFMILIDFKIEERAAKLEKVNKKMSQLKQNDNKYKQLVEVDRSSDKFADHQSYSNDFDVNKVLQSLNSEINRFDQRQNTDSNVNFNQLENIKKEYEDLINSAIYVQETNDPKMKKQVLEKKKELQDRINQFSEQYSISQTYQYTQRSSKIQKSPEYLNQNKIELSDSSFQQYELYQEQKTFDHDISQDQNQTLENSFNRFKQETFNDIEDSPQTKIMQIDEYSNKNSMNSQQQYQGKDQSFGEDSLNTRDDFSDFKQTTMRQQKTSEFKNINVKNYDDEDDFEQERNTMTKQQTFNQMRKHQIKQINKQVNLDYENGLILEKDFKNQKQLQSQQYSDFYSEEQSQRQFEIESEEEITQVVLKKPVKKVQLQNQIKEEPIKPKNYLQPQSIKIKFQDSVDELKQINNRIQTDLIKVQNQNISEIVEQIQNEQYQDELKTYNQIKQKSIQQETQNDQRTQINKQNYQEIAEKNEKKAIKYKQLLIDWEQKYKLLEEQYEHSQRSYENTIQKQNQEMEKYKKISDQKTKQLIEKETQINFLNDSNQKLEKDLLIVKQMASEVVKNLQTWEKSANVLLHDFSDFYTEDSQSLKHLLNEISRRAEHTHRKYIQSKQIIAEFKEQKESLPQYIHSIAPVLNKNFGKDPPKVSFVNRKDKTKSSPSKSPLQKSKSQNSLSPTKTTTSIIKQSKDNQKLKKSTSTNEISNNNNKTSTNVQSKNNTKKHLKEANIEQSESPEKKSKTPSKAPSSPSKGNASGTRLLEYLLDKFLAKNNLSSTILKKLKFGYYEFQGNRIQLFVEDDQIFVKLQTGQVEISRFLKAYSSQFIKKKEIELQLIKNKKQQEYKQKLNKTDDFFHQEILRPEVDTTAMKTMDEQKKIMQKNNLSMFQEMQDKKKKDKKYK